MLQQTVSLAKEFADAISESTPHVYLSMLAFTKDESKISEHY